MKTSRRLTVSYQNVGDCPEWPRRPLPPVPYLRMRGQWLEEMGFAIGAKVGVQVMPGRLVLEVIEPECVAEPHVKPARRSRVDRRHAR
jgi:type I toxin-antitoxin system toxin SymE